MIAHLEVETSGLQLDRSVFGETFQSFHDRPVTGAAADVTVEDGFDVFHGTALAGLLFYESVKRGGLEKIAPLSKFSALGSVKLAHTLQ